MNSVSHRQSQLLVIAGPAGSGKSTLCDRLILEDPTFSRVVTTTTRGMRPGEVNGEHYHFFEPEEFKRRRDAGEFIEWALVHSKPGEKERLYGSLKASVLEPLKLGQNLVMHIDVQGVQSYRDYARTDPFFARVMKTVFIQVDRAALTARMRNRIATDHAIGIHEIPADHEAEIARRMETAELEFRHANKFDFAINSRTRDEDFAALRDIVNIGAPASHALAL